MNQSKYTFSADIGSISLTYSDKGLTSVRIDHPKKQENLNSTAPDWVRSAATQIAQSVAGFSTDLSEIPLDFENQPPFFSKVYRLARKVKFGKQITYRELAAKAGSPLASRAVGQAMARNPWLIVVPCHRVLATGGGMGGFSAPGGIATKRKLLAAEQ